MKATLYIATSLNGMITKGQTDSDWVSEKDAEGFDEVCKDHGCILVGANSYNQYENVIYPIENTKNIVLTNQSKSSDNPDVFFVNSLDKALEKVKELGFERLLVAGGSNVTGQCFEAELIDRIYLSLHPVIFSKGLSMIGDFRKNMQLSFKGVKKQENEFVLLDYQVEKYEN